MVIDTYEVLGYIYLYMYLVAWEIMNIPATIPDQIDQIKEMELSYRTMHTTLNIDDDAKDTRIQVPWISLTNKYRDFLAGIITELELTPEEQRKYRFQPKTLSMDLYNTTELWSDLLVLNKCYSVIMFRPEKVRVYDAGKFKQLLNEIMILEDALP